MSMKIVGCKTEYMPDPIGIDVKNPRFSWRIEGENEDIILKSVKIEVNREDGSALWNSGFVEDPEIYEMRYEGPRLFPSTRYFWTVTVSDDHGNEIQSGNNGFETGLFDFTQEAFGGAKWIGAPEYNLSTDVRSVFGIRYRFRFNKGSNRVGFIIGYGDKRIRDRENYFKFEIDAGKEPYQLKIYRVGILPDDSVDSPIASVDIRDADSDGQEVLFPGNLYDEHEIDIQVTGNCAYTLIDGKRIDVTRKKTFFGETEAPRCLNPLGDNDVNTYPRLNSHGVFVPMGQGVDINSVEIRNLRKPYAVVYENHKAYHIDPAQKSDDPQDNLVSTAKEDAFIIKNASHTSIPILRGRFDLAEKKVKKARLYATARGIYECTVNGHRLTDTWFNPGCTQYDKHVMYQTYDITDILKPAENVVGVVLSSGWWSDAQTFVLGNFNYYGDRESFLGRIEITYEDGSIQNVVTDTHNWKYCGEGPWTYAGFFHGEHYNANKEVNIDGFDMPGFDDSAWKAPEEIPVTPIRKGQVMSEGPISWPEVNVSETSIIGQIGDSVRSAYELTALSMTEPEAGVYIYDMGVNVAGVPKLRICGKRGDTATMRYAELLYPDMDDFNGKSGSIMVENLRDADCTDLYTFKSDGYEDYIPRFTFRGYRYIEITGVTKKPELSDVKMIVMSSAYNLTSSLETSDDLTNKFIDNVRRSQQSNFISIPTDCPQRNERMGWDGDTSIFARTATFNADVRMFYERWLMDMRDLQEENGKYADIAPVGGGFGGYTYESSALHCTWELYQQYGDVQAIRDNFDSMSLFMDYSAGLWEKGSLVVGYTLGDWLAPEETDLGLICHAFYGYNTYIMERMSKAIGKEDEADKYRDLYLELKKSFNEKYFDSKTGRTKDNTQCSYALPLSYNMVNDDMISRVGERLSEKTKECGYLVLTGFFGTAPLNPMLTKTGHSEDAFKLMTQTMCPSWLYPVTQGATSIWERWDSFTKEKGFGGHNNMNSFNHYSLGAVIEWFYMYVLGIIRDEDAPGYKHFTARPYVNEAYSYVKGHFESPFGMIRAEWKEEGDSIADEDDAVSNKDYVISGKGSITNDKEYAANNDKINRKEYTYKLEIPAGSTATVILPGMDPVETGSGIHEFRFSL